MINIQPVALSLICEMGNTSKSYFHREKWVWGVGVGVVFCGWLSGVFLQLFCISVIYFASCDITVNNETKFQH